MQVSNPNNVKIYNLSAGKSLPEWLSDRKKRRLQQQDNDLRRRIELIQDFEMPAVSDCVQVTPDGNYILTTGTYKPRVRCYDVSQLSMKFERCFDAEVVKFHLLSDDYSKIVFLQCDRFVEFHTQHGKYYRTRIPKFGRDFAYHFPSCELYFVGATGEIFRLNLEQGRFLNSLKTNASSNNVCTFNPVHHLFTVGSNEGKLECWDPRSRERVGIMDCAMNAAMTNLDVEEIPAISALKYKDGLTLAVGTVTGQVLLYDIRSDRPFLVKDHLYDMPIRAVEFHSSQDLIVSMDTKIIKFWNQHTGKAFTSIEPDNDLNDLCLVANSGLMFVANEAPKLLTYYILAVGPAPRWCSFLDNITEEMEEDETPTIYDDYKFVTTNDLENLGLSHLLGTNLLRAYMHGFFVDLKLYNKAKSITDPFAYEDYRKKKIREKIEEERANRVKLKKLPKVNKNLAQKLLDVEEDPSMNKKKKNAVSLLRDDRFKAIFQNPDFQVDETSEEYRLLNPVVSKLEKLKEKQRQRDNEVIETQFDEVEPEGKASSEEESSSDDEHEWTQEMKKQHKLLQHQAKMQRRRDDEETKLQPKFYEIKSGQEFSNLHNVKKKQTGKLSLADRLQQDETAQVEKDAGVGGREMTFTLKKKKKEEERRKEEEKHYEERRKLRRSAHGIVGKQKPKFWMGKRVK